MKDTIDGSKDKAAVQLKVQELQDSAVMNNSFWKGLDLLMRVTKPTLYLLRVTDSNTPHLHEIAKLFQDAKKATLGEISSLASLGSIEHLDLRQVSEAIKTAYEHREKDIVTEMARASSFVNPKHIFCEVEAMFTCQGASEACVKVIRDYYSGKENGSSLVAEASLELNHFRTFRGWFGEEVTRNLAARAEPSDFWSKAVQHGAVKALGPLAIKLTSAFSGQGAVERYHKSIGLHRDRYSNLKQAETVEAMCEIKASQIFKRNKELEHKSKRNVLQMIKDVFDEMATTRAEREEVASTIASARAQAAAGDDYEDDLDSVDADEDAEYEAFLEELYSPSL